MTIEDDGWDDGWDLIETTTTKLNGQIETLRLVVPGGWLVRVDHVRIDHVRTVGAPVFVPLGDAP